MNNWIKDIQHVRAGKFFMNTVNTINTEGNRMLMDYMKFLYNCFSMI